METAVAQDTKKTTECPMQAEPQKEHQWLQRLVGEWDCEGEAMMGPDQPPAAWKATETVRSLGGLWFVGEGHGEMPDGGTSTTIIALGYDPQKKCYVGTFFASMMANLWVYEGQLDATGNILTLDTEGPSMTGDGKTSKYQDIVEFKSDDLRLLTSKVQGEGGQWHQVMTATYRRKK